MSTVHFLRVNSFVYVIEKCKMSLGEDLPNPESPKSSINRGKTLMCAARNVEM